MEPSMSDKKAPSVVAFVHAKGVSERLPGKNLRVLGDRPLVCHAIRNALEAKCVDLVVIDSDSDEILKVGEEAGAVPWKRPPGLATNETTGDELAYWQSMCYPEAEKVVQVVPTCPFTFSSSIDAVLDQIGREASAVGVILYKAYTWTNGSPDYFRSGRIVNSQELPLLKRETTGLYAFRQAFAARHHRRISEHSCVFITQSLIEAINIDTEEDWHLAELVWKGMQA